MAMKRKTPEHKIEGNVVTVFKKWLGEVRELKMDLDTFLWIEENGYSLSRSTQGYVTVCKKKGYTFIYQEYLHRIVLGLESFERTADHIDRDKFNNLRSNLRECSRAENNLNQGLRANNSTGVRGVWYDKRKNRYVAETKRDGKKYYVGQFISLEEAEKAVKAKRAELFGEFSGI